MIAVLSRGFLCDWLISVDFHLIRSGSCKLLEVKCWLSHNTIMGCKFLLEGVGVVGDDVDCFRLKLQGFSAFYPNS